ncbi:hypothetical protein K461DRAFT_309201 [Myriangium duriaei CBS 260.36]|uniref:Uncharacterized protein n=1 Tax=Myriangium duriaei CBS 260.36 TaxID=1168546 RepID=A0A9P4J8Y2_9PEZI|nr:hypothetical protein K461DRAFT_309201 [Myriangium duriaei CBS 260.36]
MSADLFAAFGEAPSKGTPATKLRPNEQGELLGLMSSEHQWKDTSHSTISSSNVGRVDDNDEDDFGDFEGENPWKDAESSNVESFNDFSAWNRDVKHATESTFPNQSATQQGVKSGLNSDILFDAEHSIPLDPEADDDEFGDFEEFEPATKANPAMQRQVRPVQQADHDLLSLSESKTPTMKPSAPRVSTGLSKSSSKPTTKTNPPASTPLPPAPDSATESWDDFSVTSPPVAAPTPNPSTPTSDAIPLNILLDMTLLPPSPPTLPPSNIPPPSLLLPLFPPLLTLISTTILQPLLSLPPPSRHPHLLSPALHTFLSSHQQLTQVLAHLVAGRKLRWRRDKRLAASMSISAAGRSGGMKLTGLDKTEQSREDAQVAEVVRAWRGHVGPLRAVVGAVNAVASPAPDRSGFGGLGEMVEGGRRRVLGAVPDLAGTMPVRTATVREGAVVGTVACGLCGLKREERVQKVDGDVLDSFGEWWVEKTNLHLACWRFWEGFKGNLGQR